MEETTAINELMRADILHRAIINLHLALYISFAPTRPLADEIKESTKTILHLIELCKSNKDHYDFEDANYLSKVTHYNSILEGCITTLELYTSLTSITRFKQHTHFTESFKQLAEKIPPNSQALIKIPKVMIKSIYGLQRLDDKNHKSSRSELNSLQVSSSLNPKKLNVPHLRQAASASSLSLTSSLGSSSRPQPPFKNIETVVDCKPNNVESQECSKQSPSEPRVKRDTFNPDLLRLEDLMINTRMSASFFPPPPSMAPPRSAPVNHNGNTPRRTSQKSIPPLSPSKVSTANSSPTFSNTRLSQELPPIPSTSHIGGLSHSSHLHKKSDYGVHETLNFMLNDKEFDSDEDIDFNETQVFKVNRVTISDIKVSQIN